jgi:hypothetical protein
MPAIHINVCEQNRKFVVNCESGCYERAGEKRWDDYETVGLTFRAETDPGFH